MSPNKGIYFNSYDWGSKGATRASSVRLDRADIVVQGNTGKAVEESISGALTIAGGGMSQFIHYYSASHKNHTLRVGSLVMEPGAMLDIHFLQINTHHTAGAQDVSSKLSCTEASAAYTRT